ncbi:hypothetical protein OZ664_06495 [Elizabethkingia sp. HX WHF]|uniref:hypothetical protein n=1 Tax=Elizabethkingia TaxID=308865 RepID=UPI00099A0FA5|nr:MULTISPECIES: hypothetical protein [Elizabethkingia]ATL42578.1 hypothetical protein CQS02_04290 [Elizabethkingia miricola]MCL1637121.1 hypothetical protein [Elizabethkingia bruuniana]MDX8563644.1 hypothetical protein [Elizabethkingia sp. HX WHF]OPC20092.1 hypothetical protein BAY00_11405 [Elizabethkingia bruuniana]OPC59156.1 hypothetical protein BAY07_02515 [Elizabethkingia bruuniana]
MPAEKSLKKVFQYEYLVNAEYLKDILQENNISAIIDYQNKSLFVEDNDINKAILIINEENIDESKTIDQENFMEEYDEWNRNSLNPGHYLGGHIPFFYKTRSNHLKFAIIALISLIIQIVLLFITTNIDLWNILFLIVTIITGINFLISWLNYKLEKETHNNFS